MVPATASERQGAKVPAYNHLEAPSPGIGLFSTSLRAQRKDEEGRGGREQEEGRDGPPCMRVTSYSLPTWPCKSMRAIRSRRQGKGKPGVMEVHARCLLAATVPIVCEFMDGTMS